jgi:hypothetical protein
LRGVTETAPLAPDLEKLDEQLFAQFLGRQHHGGHAREDGLRLPHPS